MDFVIQAVAGIVVGNVICAAMKQHCVSIAFRSVIAAIGGLLGGLVFNLASSGGMEGALVDFYAGGFGGAILTPIVGALLASRVKTPH